MATFTGTGIDPEIQQRVLEFLNSALTAAEIAGIEPQEGPVFDDPTKGPGDQVRDYDIGGTICPQLKTSTLASNSRVSPFWYFSMLTLSAVSNKDSALRVSIS